MVLVQAVEESIQRGHFEELVQQALVFQIVNVLVITPHDVETCAGARHQPFGSEAGIPVLVGVTGTETDPILRLATARPPSQQVQNRATRKAQQAPHRVAVHGRQVIRSGEEVLREVNDRADKAFVPED